MAEGLESWRPFATRVQGGLPDGNFANGQFILICSGPPYFSQLGFGGSASKDADLGATLVYPIGLTQNLALSQNKSISRIFELGSDRSYFIAGRSVGQLSFGRVYYHGPSLLRTLYAYYDTSNDANVDAFKIRPLYQSGGVGVKPLGQSVGLHSVRIPPGYDNLMINLASDLFSQPTGLLLVLKDNNESNIGAVYVENCMVPQHSFATDAQGLIIQESVGIQYERLMPIKLANLELLDGLLADDTGGYAAAGSLI